MPDAAEPPIWPFVRRSEPAADESAPEPLSPRQRSVLQILAEQGPAGASALARELWPDAPPRRRRGVVHLITRIMLSRGLLIREEGGRFAPTSAGLAALSGTQ